MKIQKYKNPLLFADYSDPDVIRTGSDFYMVSSSFTYLPGVPVLHSKDLIHWELISHCVEKLPYDRYNVPQHGCGTWAPSIRYHEGIYYVFIPLPDEGILVAAAADPAGKWTLQRLCKAKGWIDPCPLWDEDGKIYMVFAYAKSRCGIKSRISICEIDKDTQKILSAPVCVYDGTTENPTIEGPKLYKRDGYYYIFAPAGGVPEGWQTVLRSKNIYGPYESRIVMHQGNTNINGPHQGGYIELEDGSCWFLHFQDRSAYGRVTCLEPMNWNAGWPFIGIEKNGDGIGEPVDEYDAPAVFEMAENDYRILRDDEFDEVQPGLQWQWQANPNTDWYEMGEKTSCIRLNIIQCTGHDRALLWYMPNVFTQLPQAEKFTATVKLRLNAEITGDEAGLGILGHDYTYLSVQKTNTGFDAVITEGHVVETTGVGYADEKSVWRAQMHGAEVWIRVSMNEGAVYKYSYSEDGNIFLCASDKEFVGSVSTWTGMKLMLAVRNSDNSVSGGSADFDYIRFN